MASPTLSISPMAAPPRPPNPNRVYVQAGDGRVIRGGGWVNGGGRASSMASLWCPCSGGSIDARPHDVHGKHVASSSTSLISFARMRPLRTSL